MAAIVVNELHKSYGAYDAVRGVSFSVAAGRSVALLGPNGAGKTTTIEILEGYREATRGAVSVLGSDPATGGASFRRRVGIVLQEAGLPLELYYPNPVNGADVIEVVGLTDRRDVRAKYLSGGEQRRLDLALGIVGRPEILFLDEPTTGFDPSARRIAWDMISGLVREGVTVLLTTHYLEEARVLSDRILIMAGGRLVADGAPDEIGSQAARGEVAFDLPRGVSPSDLPRLSAADEVCVEGDGVRISTADVVHTTHAVTTWALDRRLDLSSLRVEPSSLEDAYLDIVARAEGGAR
jgi:ABC-2 type transport system ATP-binding protein